MVHEYRFSDTIVVDGRIRTYAINLPPVYYDSSGFALVIAMHGGGGDAAQFESSSKLTEKANAAHSIVVYPEGVQSTGQLKARTWNAGSCCDYASENKIDDVAFISRLADKLIRQYKINPKKIYATGHSNGGMMAYRLACALSGKIAAIAVNACSMVVTEPCNPLRPVPVLHMHAASDTHVPYQGGTGTGFSNAWFPPVDSVLHVWSDINGCVTPPEIVAEDKYTFTQWMDGNNHVTVQYYLTQDGGHAWPGGLRGRTGSDEPSTAIHANDLLWNFFQQYQLP
jgi:polyhydroxybutyrate depolymerase